MTARTVSSAVIGRAVAPYASARVKQADTSPGPTVAQWILETGEVAFAQTGLCGDRG